ncbi:hypothetical protein [Dactylosporangium sp. CA-233914]|uniref:hypothetical protein n=1 Tax=Dactylosporangium sp. CA-233914 TaxID=3239934 RepID=UPI003D925405
MTVRVVTEFARRPVANTGTTQRPAHLTAREIEVVRLVAGGLANEEIGRAPYIGRLSHPGRSDDSPNRERHSP